MPAGEKVGIATHNNLCTSTAADVRSGCVLCETEAEQLQCGIVYDYWYTEYAPDHPQNLTNSSLVYNVGYLFPRESTDNHP